MIKTLKSLALAGVLALSVVPFMNIGLSAYAESGSVFADGNNAYSGHTTSSTHDSSWDAALDVTGLGGGASNVIGAKITIYTVGGSKAQELKNCSTLEQKKTIINSYLQGDGVGAAKWTTGAGVGNPTFVINNGSYNNYITYNSPYYPGPTKSWKCNGTNTWMYYNDDGVPVFGGQTLSNMHATGYSISDALYNSSIWNITSNTFSFAGANGGTLPTSVQNEVIRVTAEMMNASNDISSGDYVVWFIEPLVNVEIKGTNGNWYSGVAATPSMIAKLYDNGKANGIKSWSEKYVNLTGTDRLAGAGSNSASKTGLAGKLNQDGYGAYAVVVEPEQLVTHDKLPEIPSVPIFQKTDGTMEYMGISATVPQDVWDEITSVLSYAMKLTDTVPSGGLYSTCSSQITSMRQYADNVLKSDGSYESRYINAYTALWLKICSYYNSRSVDLARTTASPSVRNSITQPTSCSYKFGGSSGPFTVTPVLGGVSGETVSLTYKSAKFYKLNGSTSIVNTSTTSESSLGGVVGTAPTSVKVSDILKNPYAYSIVIESEGTLGGGAYPEPPNIVIWDEETDQTWEASIANSDWNLIINTLKYARADGVNTNPTTIGAANTAHSDAIYLNGISVNTYNTWRVNLKKYQAELNSIRSFQTALGSAVNELNGYLNVSFLYDYDPAYPIYTIYDVDNNGTPDTVECKNDNFGCYSNYATYGVYSRTGSSGFARTDIFTANTDYQSLTSKSNMLGWYNTYKNYMYDNYYNSFMDNLLYTRNVYGSESAKALFPQYNYTNYTDSNPNNWTPLYKMPGDGYETTLNSNPRHAITGYLDFMCTKYVEVQRNAYNDLLNNYIPSTISDLESAISDLTGKINEYDAHLNSFKTNYETTVNTFMNYFQGKTLVTVVSNNNGNITNNVTTLLCKRTGGTAFEGMSQKYKYPVWQLSTGDPKQVSVTNVQNSGMYSAYKADGSSYTIGPIGNSIKGTLDALYEDGRNNLNFKYRVVKTSSPTTVMTTSNIKRYKNSSCSAGLTYSDVLAAPYSFGIIINSYKLDESTTQIKEWQLSRRMQKDLREDSIWNWTGSSKTFNFEPSSSSMMISQPPKWDTKNTLLWITGRKTGVSGPGLSAKKLYTGNGYVGSTGLSSSITTAEVGWTSTDYTGTALYKVTHNWGGNSGTIEVLTAEITAKAVYTPVGHMATVDKNPSTFDYGSTEGSTFDIWRDNGTIEIKADFPMMVASANASPNSNPYPTKASGTIQVLNTDNGYAPAWCASPVTHSLTSPYYVKVSYGSNSKIRTTFSTDKQDTDDMAKYVGSGDIVPYLKAGQTVEGEIINNYITLDGYCNVQNDGQYVNNNDMVYKTADDFRNYMNRIADQLKDCNVEVISTINGFNVKSDNTARDNAQDFAVTLTQAGRVDNDAGVRFDSSYATQSAVKTINTDAFGIYGNKFRPFGGTNSAPSTSTLGIRTFDAYNNSLFNLGEGIDNWYWEYSEALGIIHYQIIIEFEDFKFNGTISRYESDSNSATDEYLNNQKDTIKDAWANSFGYNTYLGKTNNEYTNVIVTAIDLSGLTGDARALFTDDAGNEIQAILGKQTPIHIRGSVYDNT